MLSLWTRALIITESNVGRVKICHLQLEGYIIILGNYMHVNNQLHAPTAVPKKSASRTNSIGVLVDPSAPELLYLTTFSQ
jgi:hypothetical protein